MKYNYEYKRKCVELYRQGKWPETPELLYQKVKEEKRKIVII